jgi:hypothetical protein
MLGNQPVVMFTFAGRQRYMEMLVHYSLRCRPFVDKHAICVHTANPRDLEYIHGLFAKYPDYFVPVEIGFKAGPPRYSQFFEHFTDPNTFYVKLDDDIIWMEDGAIEALVRYKQANPGLLMAFSNTVNNGLCNHLHQRTGALRSNLILPWDAYFVSYGADAPRIHQCKDAHESFLDNLKNGKLNLYKFSQWRLQEGNIRFSINCLCMTGPDIQGMLPVFNAEREKNNTLSADDESVMSEQLPGLTGRINAICGTSLVCHYAFGVQHAYLSETHNILDRYRSLIGLGPWRNVAN